MRSFCIRVLLALLTFSPLLAADPADPIDLSSPPIELPPAEQGRADHFFTELMNMASTLGLVLLGLLIVTWLLKRTVAARVDQLNVTSNIKILERRSLAPKVAVYVLDVWGTRLIVGETPAGLTRLGEVAPGPESGKFANLLKEKPDRPT